MNTKEVLKKARDQAASILGGTIGKCHEVSLGTVVGAYRQLSKKVAADLRLCEGIVWFAPHQKFSNHGWVEFGANGEFVYDAQADVFIDRAQFYEFGQVKLVHRYTVLEAFKLYQERNYAGPFADEVHEYEDK